MGCQRCGAVVSDGRNGQPRKWCSENCRKRAADDASRARCTRCNKPLGGRSGWPDATRKTSSGRCGDCRRVLGRLKRTARLKYVARMYEQGLSTREIAIRLGMAPTSRPPELTLARRAGLITTYRNRGYGEAA